MVVTAAKPDDWRATVPDVGLVWNLEAKTRDPFEVTLLSVFVNDDVCGGHISKETKTSLLV